MLHYLGQKKAGRIALSELDPTEQFNLYYSDRSSERLSKEEFYSRANDGKTILKKWIVLDLDFEHKGINLSDNKNPLIDVFKLLDVAEFKYTCYSTEEGRGIKILLSFKELLHRADYLETKRNLVNYFRALIPEAEIKTENTNCTLLYPYKPGEARLHAKTNKPIEIIHYTGYNNEIPEACYAISKDKNGIQGIRTKVITYLLEKKGDKAFELIATEFLNRNQIYTIRGDDKTEMWLYIDGIYKPQGKSYIKEFIRQIMGVAYTTQVVNKIICKIEVDTFIESKDFFNRDTENPELICLQNGLFNLLTRELMPFDSSKIFFNKLPISYDPDAKCPSIIKFFGDVIRNKEDVKVLQELFGFVLYREYLIEKAFMFSGNGRNGKGKTINLLKKFIGDNWCAIPLQDIGTDQYAVSELFGKLVNLAGDIDSKTMANTGLFKGITARDPISAPRKFLPRLNFVNYAKMIFCANELPAVNDMSKGFWERWNLIEFPYTFVGQEELINIPEEDKWKYKLKDPNIINKIATEEELNGCLNWALDGLDRLLKKKQFSMSKNTEAIKEFWIRKTNSFRAFISDFIIEDWDSKILKDDVRKMYSMYCRNYKLKQLGEKTIKDVFSEIGVDTGQLNREKGGERVWNGCKFGVPEELQQVDTINVQRLVSIDAINKKFKEKIKDSSQASQASQGILTLIKKKFFSIESEYPVMPVMPVTTILKDIDSTKPFSVNSLLEHKGLNIDIVFKELAILIKEGSITEIKPGVYQKVI